MIRFQLLKHEGLVLFSLLYHSSCCTLQTSPWSHYFFMFSIRFIKNENSYSPNSTVASAPQFLTYLIEVK